MSPPEVLAVLALSGWVIYRQTTPRSVIGERRFKPAVIVIVTGLAVGGFDLPSGTAGWALVCITLALSVGVGVARGRLTRIWRDAGGTVLRSGTALTGGLFVALIAVKLALGTFAAVNHIDDGAGIGEVLVMTGLMFAVQAEIVWRRARALGDATLPVHTAAAGQRSPTQEGHAETRVELPR